MCLCGQHMCTQPASHLLGVLAGGEISYPTPFLLLFLVPVLLPQEEV